MKAVSGKRLCQILKKKGWKLNRINGSHHIYVKSGITLPIPQHGNKSLKIGLQKYFMKIAEIDEAEL